MERRAVFQGLPDDRWSRPALGIVRSRAASRFRYAEPQGGRSRRSEAYYAAPATRPICTTGTKVVEDFSPRHAGLRATMEVDRRRCATGDTRLDASDLDGGSGSLPPSDWA